MSTRLWCKKTRTCSRFFYNKKQSQNGRDLQVHMDKRHSSRFPFPCEQCNNTYPTFEDLQYHVNKRHFVASRGLIHFVQCLNANNRSFQCSWCRTCRSDHSCFKVTPLLVPKITIVLESLWMVGSTRDRKTLLSSKKKRQSCLQEMLICQMCWNRC